MPNVNELYPIAGTSPSPVDDRDYPLIIPDGYVPQHSRKVLQIPAPIYQGRVGSCVAHMKKNQVRSMQMEHGGEDFPVSRQALYTMTTAYENRIGQGGGLYTRDIYKVMGKYGAVKEQDWPYDPNLEPINDVPQSIYDMAEQYGYRTTEYQAVHKATDDGINEEYHDIVNKVCWCIDNGIAVGISMQVSADIYNMRGPLASQVYKAVGLNNPSIGGHAMLIVGYDFNTDQFILVNSWGGWGDHQGLGGFKMAEVAKSPYLELYALRGVGDIYEGDEPGFYFIEQNSKRAAVRLTVSEDRIGTYTSLWCGAILPDGTAMMKQPYFSLGPRGTSEPQRPLTQEDIQQSNFLKDKDGGYDQWDNAAHGVDPFIARFKLKRHNYIRVFAWSDLRQIRGTRIYLEEGDVLNLNEAEHVFTVTG